MHVLVELPISRRDRGSKLLGFEHTAFVFTRCWRQTDKQQTGRHQHLKPPLH